jgi:hypothetical protein
MMPLASSIEHPLFRKDHIVKIVLMRSQDKIITAIIIFMYLFSFLCVILSPLGSCFGERGFCLGFEIFYATVCIFDVIYIRAGGVVDVHLLAIGGGVMSHISPSETVESLETVLGGVGHFAVGGENYDFHCYVPHFFFSVYIISYFGAVVNRLCNFSV